MATILYPNGTNREVYPANGDYFEYDELMQIVEGEVEMIPLPDGRIMTLNAEGKADVEAGVPSFPPNRQASALAGFSSNESPLNALRGLGVAPPTYAVGLLDLPYIPGTVLVSTKQEASWTD